MKRCTRPSPSSTAQLASSPYDLSLILYPAHNARCSYFFLRRLCLSVSTAAFARYARQIEKIVLFFLSKQGELAGDLLSSRREQRKWMAYESTWRGGTGEDMAEEGGDDRSISYCSSPGITQHTVYCAIGREIAELMRFLHLNGKLCRLNA